MSKLTRFDHYITSIFLIAIITLVATAYFTFKAVLSLHFKQQQEAMLPLYSLINSEVIRPLMASHYMANDEFFLHHINQEQVDKKMLLDYLQKLSATYNMLTFVALEKHNLMLDSTNKSSTLSAENAEWYHRLKIEDKIQFTDIGNADDPHLYFDIKMFIDNRFVGFTGIGVDLNYFANTFAKLSTDYGFELYFVADNNDIMLSSSALMKTESHHRKDEVVSITELPWYQSYQQTGANQQGQIISVNGAELAISQLLIKEINWRVYIVAPPASEQNAYWQVFFSRFALFVFVASLLYYLFHHTLKAYKNRVVANAEIDFLTQLPNRSYINWRFDQISAEHQNISIVMADIDHFKTINDNHGHLVGDAVLKSVADCLSANVRKMDIVGRWGGEEFILLFPDTELAQVVEVIERIRHNIAQLPFENKLNKQAFQTTMSFGISHGLSNKSAIKSLIEQADQALYQAKHQGRNRVICYSKAALENYL